MQDNEYGRRKDDQDIEHLEIKLEKAIESHSSFIEKSTFWTVLVILIGVVSSVFGFIITEKAAVHQELIDRISELEKGDGGYDKRITVLEERYNVIVLGISELKAMLKDHDKGR